MTIQYLHRVTTHEDAEGNQVTRPPNNAEIMVKLNEIISVVNRLDNEINDIKIRRIFEGKGLRQF